MEKWYNSTQFWKGAFFGAMSMLASSIILTWLFEIK